MTTAVPAVSARGVGMTYQARSRSVTALEGLDMQAHEGEFVALLGPSGCGKSTALGIVAGLLPATEGHLEVLGRPVRGPVTEIGMVFQRDLLMPWRTVVANVMLQAEIRKLPKAEFVGRATRLLEQVGLAGFEKRMPTELSGGMRQRVALCRGLLHDPRLLLLDEPFGALDAMTRDQLNLDLQDFTFGTDKTVLLVTHSIQEACFLSDRVLVMSPRPGRVIEEINIELPRPRTFEVRDSSEFVKYASEVRRIFEGMGVLGHRSRRGTPKPDGLAATEPARKETAL